MHTVHLLAQLLCLSHQHYDEYGCHRVSSFFEGRPPCALGAAFPGQEAYLGKLFDRGGVLGSGEPQDAHAPICANFGSFHSAALGLNFNREALEALKARKLFYRALQKPSRWNKVLKRGCVFLSLSP